MSLFKRVDYKLLRHQKFVLLEMQDKLQGKWLEAVEGVIQFIDAFQDEATLTIGGASEEEVYGVPKQVHCDICESAWITTIQEDENLVYRCNMCIQHIQDNEPVRILPEMNCINEFITDSGN